MARQLPVATIAATLVSALFLCAAVEAAPQNKKAAAPSACKVGLPPTNLGLDPFYRKYCVVSGIPVVSSEHVPDAALQMAAEIVSQMLSRIPAVREKLVGFHSRIAIIGKDQVTSDIPEYKPLLRLMPDLDRRTRGLGAANPNNPVSSGAEENLLCLEVDRYRGENIFVHEFAHTIKALGIQVIDPGFRTKVQQTYDHAKGAGLWANTYAISNPDEYWAEGVQSYFDTKKFVDPPNGIHNSISTRAKLKGYDPDLFSVIDAAFKGLAWQPRCP
jgi:hypothetical protein